MIAGVASIRLLRDWRPAIPALLYTVDSRYLEVEGTLWDTSRYPYFDTSELQNGGKYQLNN